MAEKSMKTFENGKEKFGAGNFLCILVALVFFAPLFLSSDICCKELSATELESAEVSAIFPQWELPEMFNPMSNSTNFQRSTKLEELKGKVVSWNLPLYEISKIGANEFRITTSAGKSEKTEEGNSPYVNCSIKLTARGDADISKLLELKTGDMIRIKGVLTGTTNVGRALEIEPAVLDNGKIASVTFMKCGVEEDSLFYFVGLDSKTNKERWFVADEKICEQYGGKKNIGKVLKVRYFEEAVAFEGGDEGVGETFDSVVVE